MSHPHLHWSLALHVLAPIAAYAVVYAWRFRAARREAGGRGAGWFQLAAFSSGLIVLAAAIASPIDGLGEDYLFTMHMTQHVLLGDLAPVLLLLGLSRVIMRPLTRRLTAVERRLGPFAHPATGLAVWFVLVYLWHIPVLYDAALDDPVVHGLEHASFFVAGVALWWPLIQPVPMRRRLTGLAPFAYIVAAKVGLGPLGLYLVWSNELVYDHYATVPRIWGLDAVEDQRTGGALMMLEQSLLLIAAFVILFVRMLERAEEEDRRQERLEDAATA